MFLRRVAAIAFAAFAGVCEGGALDNLQRGNPQAQHVWRAPTDSVVLPFEWHDGHLIVGARVNGSTPLRLAFDSGASATVLFETERTRGLQLLPERQIAIGGASAVDLVNDATLSLGGIDITPLTILHVPLSSSPLFANDDESYFDGAFGYDALRGFVTEIDYANQLIRFFKGVGPDTAEPAWSIVPIDVSTRVPMVRVQVQSPGARPESIRLLVDTGAPAYAYLNPELTKRVRIPTRNYLTRGRSFNGPYERYTARLEKFSLGGVDFAGLATHFDRTDFKNLGRSIGLIGNGVLRNFDLVFDYRAGTLAMRRNAHHDTSSKADRSGIDLQPHRHGAIVRSVAARSAASRLGLKPGDIVTDIDGLRFQQANWDEVKALLSSDRETITVCWSAGNERSCERLPLVNRL